LDLKSVNPFSSNKTAHGGRNKLPKMCSVNSIHVVKCITVQLTSEYYTNNYD